MKHLIIIYIFKRIISSENKSVATSCTFNPRRSPIKKFLAAYHKITLSYRYDNLC